MIKRAIDIGASAAGLLLLAPLLALVALLVKIDSAGPVLFTQQRVGRGFKPFRILKFRTMVVDAPRTGPAITFGEDPRISRVGRVLRRYKLDELPQLVNVLRGEMSLVGPRPEVPKYVDLYRSEFATVLAVRPGLTDVASLKYRNEASILGRAADAEEEYVHRLLPDKIRLAQEYVRTASLRLDLLLIARTLARLALPERDDPSDVARRPDARPSAAAWLFHDRTGRWSIGERGPFDGQEGGRR